MMSKTFYTSELKDKKCGLCEYYSGAKRIEGYSKDQVRVDWEGTCSYKKNKAAAVHGSCSHFEVCGQALKLLSEIEAKKARKEAAREAKRTAELNRREQEKAMARAKSESTVSSYDSSNSSSGIYYGDPLPRLTKAELAKLAKEREEYNKEKKKSKANCWIFTAIGIASAILGFVMTFVGVNVGTDKAALFVALVIIGMVGLLCAIVFFIISIVKWRKHQNKYGR